MLENEDLTAEQAAVAIAQAEIIRDQMKGHLERERRRIVQQLAQLGVPMSDTDEESSDGE